MSIRETSDQKPGDAGGLKDLDVKLRGLISEWSLIGIFRSCFGGAGPPFKSLRHRRVLYRRIFMSPGESSPQKLLMIKEPIQ